MVFKLSSKLLHLTAPGADLCLCQIKEVSLRYLNPNLFSPHVNIKYLYCIVLYFFWTLPKTAFEENIWMFSLKFEIQWPTYQVTNKHGGGSMQINANVKPIIKSWTTMLFCEMFWWDLFWALSIPKYHLLLTCCQLVKLFWFKLNHIFINQREMSSNTDSQNSKTQKLNSEHLCYDKLGSVTGELLPCGSNYLSN